MCAIMVLEGGFLWYLDGYVSVWTVTVTPAVSTRSSGIVGCAYDSGVFDLVVPYFLPYFIWLKMDGRRFWSAAVMGDRWVISGAHLGFRRGYGEFWERKKDADALPPGWYLAVWLLLLRTRINYGLTTEAV